MVIAKSKKVKPQTNTIKKMDYNWAPGPEPPNNQETGVPRAIFIPHANSLPFEERRVTLEQPVKIGRNVYRATPTPTNTIFECRVLSRHHATLYYDKGHFYLVDNQSSNGTFINNNSISKDQEPHEVFSGDVVQFGISVVENAGNSEKNTFPPVVALLKLFHPDGKEAKLSFNPGMTTPVKELYQLNNYVQDAIQREAALESRLQTLRECVERTRAEAQSAWELFVGEQRLLMRVHTLESMLAAGKQPDSQHVAQLLDDKRNYQEVAQESLRVAHEQRLSLEESLERRAREAASLHQHNCALRTAANDALTELQKLAVRCERKLCAARMAISAAEEREAAVRAQLPLAYSVQNGEAKMLVLSSDGANLSDGQNTQNSQNTQNTINSRDKRPATLEDAVRALPDYIKMLLPQNVLNKVGIKAITADGKSSKEFELILKKNNIYDAEIRDNTESEDGTVVSTDEMNETRVPIDIGTDDEKQLRLNHDTDDSSSPLDGELCADNNANSTYDDNATEDSPSKGGVEYANVLRVMGGLNEEIRALRERLGATAGENERLRAVRDELLAAPDPAAADDLPAYRTRVADLQAQLSRSSLAEEANLAEMKRLSATAAELQAELASRPTRAEHDDLSSALDRLRADLATRDDQLQALRQGRLAPRTERATETGRSLEDLRVEPVADISDEIDEMFRLDFDDEEEEPTDSAATEVAPAAPARLDDDERLRATLAAGPLTALEEELVRAKEQWAEASAERARLAAQLCALQAKPSAALGRLLALALPVAAAALCWLLLPYVS